MDKTISPGRRYSPLDRLIGAFDEALRLATGAGPGAQRDNPAGDHAAGDLDEAEQRRAAGLMRINHAGEVCAQALYAGQAATARNPEVQRKMRHAALEEIDHLVWCEQRLQELGSRPSLLNPLWYAGSFTIGAAAGLAGDAWSLGFLQETENQVEAHLQEHLDRLPHDDARSRAIVAQMKVDEASHAAMAEAAGARPLPAAIRAAMRMTAGVMKGVAYRL